MALKYDKSLGQWVEVASVVNVRFIRNWNNKLLCEYFTTIRRRKIEANVGDVVNAILSGAPPFQAQIMIEKKVTMQSITESMTYIDAGLSKSEFAKVMNKMYPNDDMNKGNLYFYVMKRLDTNLFSETEI